MYRSREWSGVHFMQSDRDLDCALHSRSRTVKPNNGLGLFQITKPKLTSNSSRSKMDLFSSLSRLTNGVKLTLHHRHHVFHRRLFHFSLAPKVSQFETESRTWQIHADLGKHETNLRFVVACCTLNEMPRLPSTRSNYKIYFASQHDPTQAVACSLLLVL